MTKFIKGKDGKFAGSIGEGKDLFPTYRTPEAWRSAVGPEWSATVESLNDHIELPLHSMLIPRGKNAKPNSGLFEGIVMVNGVLFRTKVVKDAYTARGQFEGYRAQLWTYTSTGLGGRQILSAADFNRELGNSR